ncbi:unnamed protein product [Darwinula stevensoni]|uniref:Signal peptidase complex subunit 2 n=1 Tax=Darwinula stevensoni TaxID=69355 RepID=A0A7R8WZL6_9CRUS|nr:unnamed protein product [Darwinula stevensoni]CAG0880693.1 unnamed protein product [Darwinula stevensoni]
MASKSKDKEKEEKETKPIKVDKWDGSAVKNALDDAVKELFTKKYGYKESHALMDGRLGLSGVAVCLALLALAWDYIYPFPQSRMMLIFCVVMYFFLMGIFTIYTNYYEKGIFLVALDKDKAGIDPDIIWEASSSIKRFDDMYILKLCVRGSRKKPARSGEMKKSIATWFDERGNLLTDLFHKELSRLHDSLAKPKKDM